LVMNVQPRPFIFIDFDGTITEEDTIIEIMEEFAPEEWVKLKEETLSRQISIRKGVGGMFSLLSSVRRKEIISFAKKKTRIREGFGDFLHFCDINHFDFRVLSGGIDFYIYPLLEKLVPKEKIVCNRADFSAPNIQVVWEYPCDVYCHLDCGACKVSLIRTYDPGSFHRALIGDSITDFGAAEIADRVIARGSLLTQCQERGIPAAPFNHFFDVIQLIKNDQTLS
jgi:2-hydroxy-3-keto-5-methylthiopentenyl-1-phosphate phosphatase